MTLLQEPPFITLDPTGIKQVTVNSLAPRLATFNGARVGLLHNTKVNARQFLETMTEVLGEQFELGEVVGPVLTAGEMRMLATPDQIRDMAERCDIVLVAIGDCGSCAGCSVVNATELEKLGVPAVVFATEPFARTVESMSRRRGFPGYGHVLVEQPLSSATAADLRRKSEAVLREVLAVSLGSHQN